MYFNLDRSIFDQMKLMSMSGYQFLFPEQYLSLLDVMKNLCDGIRGLALDLKECEFDGHDIGKLINEIHRTVCLQPLLLSYNCIKYLFEKLSKKNINITKCIYPCENNSTEKTLILGIRQYYPQSKIIGFQHTVWFKEQLGFFLLPDEISYHPLPDYIVCSGSKYPGILKKAGFPEKILLPGPNLRYTAVNQDLKFNQAGRGNKIKKTLIILNYDTIHNLELLEKTGKALKLRNDVKVYIKAHPTTPVKRIDAFLGEIDFPAYEWATGSVQDGVIDSDLVFMTGGSVSNMETMATGVPLIRVSLENNFDFDCLWDEYPFAPFTSSIKEISHYMDKAFQMTAKERERLIAFGKEVVKNYFEPVSEKNQKVFLKI
jgi:surface carbohydrate biosynthesis protein (TIGR04326 family)